MIAYLIDPVLERITEIELADNNDRKRLDQMRALIGAASLDNAMISQRRDTVWLDDGGLRRGEPIAAFKLPFSRDPLAGNGVVIGCDQRGITRAPVIPIFILREEVVWLGRIIPEVTWEETEHAMRAIVTYTRVAR